MKQGDSFLEHIVERLAKRYARALLLRYIIETAPEAANDNSPPEPDNEPASAALRSARQIGGVIDVETRPAAPPASPHPRPLSHS